MRTFRRREDPAPPMRVAGIFPSTVEPERASGRSSPFTDRPNMPPTDMAPDTTEPLPLEPGAPVIARGRLTTINGTPVVQARVDAYAMVAGAQGMRPNRIAQTICDYAGIFVLQLPAELGTNGGEAAETTDMDAGVGLDASE